MNLLNPQDAALMTLGTGLLRGSGPSRIPMPFGAILGGAGEDAIKAYQAAAQAEILNTLKAEQLKDALAQRQMQFTLSFRKSEEDRKLREAEGEKNRQSRIDLANIVAANKPEPLKPVEVDGKVLYVPQSQASGMTVGNPRQPNKSLPPNALKDLGEKGEAVTTFGRLSDTFKDDYAGKGSQMFGNLQNMIGRNVGAGFQGQADWWQDYQRQKNIVRNKLFGSALTVNETAEFEKADINPGMTPELIKKNLARQKAAADRAARRLAKAYAAGGYSKDQIEESLGMPLESMEAPDQSDIMNELRKRGVIK